MNFRSLYAQKGDPILHEKWNALLDLVGALLEGPKVCPPLAVKDGVIYLADEFEAWDAVTTTAFAARSGATMASGSARLRLAKGPTLTSLTTGGSLVTAYNFTGGTIAAGVPCIVVRIRGEWRIVAADCSGVAA